MKYTEALENLYSKPDRNSYFVSPFRVYSFLADVCSSDVSELRICKSYYELNKLINVLFLIQEQPIDDALAMLVPYYQKVRNKVQIDDFKKCVRGVVELVYPHYFENLKLKEKGDKNIVKVVHATVAEPKETVTPIGEKHIPKTPNKNQVLPLKPAQNKVNKQPTSLIRVNRDKDVDMDDVKKINVQGAACDICLYNDPRNIVRAMDPSGKFLAVHVRKSKKGTLSVTVKESNDYHDPVKLKVEMYLDLSDVDEICIRGKKHEGKVYFIGDGKDLKINAFNIQVTGNFENLDLTSDYGDITFNGNADKIRCQSRSYKAFADVHASFLHYRSRKTCNNGVIVKTWEHR